MIFLDLYSENISLLLGWWHSLKWSLNYIGNSLSCIMYDLWRKWGSLSCKCFQKNKRKCKLQKVKISSCVAKRGKNYFCGEVSFHYAAWAKKKCRVISKTQQGTILYSRFLHCLKHQRQRALGISWVVHICNNSVVSIKYS